MPTVCLTHDGALTLTAEPGVADEWIPLARAEGIPGRAHLDVTRSPVPVDPLDRAPTLRLLDVSAWIDDQRLVLRNAIGTLTGSADLDRCRADLGIGDGASAEPLCTVTAAVLLGRLGRALVHAAGVVDPAGRAWLLVGDSHSGKSTTLATLIRSGWRWLADDQVVLRDGGAGVVVEGWPRALNLDRGFEDGRITGERTVTTSDRFAPATRSEWPLGGAFLLRIEAGSPTTVGKIGTADGFAALVRQSPWVLADPRSAPAVQRLLVATAETRQMSLRLGKDAYAAPEFLSAILRSAVEPG